MRMRALLFLMGLLALTLSGCSGDQVSPITPAVDNATFLFFFTEG